MKDKEVCILSTRPVDGALIEKAAHQNIVIDTIAFIEVKKMISNKVAGRINSIAGEKATVVFTSMNAVEIVVETVPITPLMPDWKIYCIGGATFTLVKKYWPYDNVIFTAKDANELADRIIENKEKSVYFFCGNKRREELPTLLQKQNIEVEELVVYETIETPQSANKTYDGLLFFSPSAVHSFFSYNKPAAETIFFAIGNTTASAIKQFSTNSIIVSDFPAKDQLIDKAIEYFTERPTNVSRKTD
ncbi:uroporphyrinogen-III synthase [Segetibacter aerophilus]|uniref:Uroporphyrinogen III methyltransferase n=1 Tax=Segetibacter aerophilus TaxID=670293 RepID=A0A512BCV5_9BACT|nr:uroporphyrinogen-III synthase [Segetibacter aerophilus]GEO09803.1 uroporphyrinogen III methyltransferase [Segetibacter aerophilus]